MKMFCKQNLVLFFSMLLPLPSVEREIGRGSTELVGVMRYYLRLLVTQNIYFAASKHKIERGPRFLGARGLIFLSLGCLVC